MCKYPNLFKTFKLGNTLFRNRIFASPTGPTHLDAGNHIAHEIIGYYERKAMGGAASVCIGDAQVDSVNGKSNVCQLHLDDTTSLASVPLWKLTNAITRHGAVASMELCHSGSGSRQSYREGHAIYGPSEVALDVFGVPVHAQEMPPEIIERVIRQFAAAAAFSKYCGFGMVTIHGGHGWLLGQFMSETMNRRTDEWGGSFEKRMRFPIAVARAVRAAVGPGFPIEMRISGSECHSAGWDIDYGVRMSKAFEQDGTVDMLHVSAGTHELVEVFGITHPHMFLPDGVNVKYAAEIKKHVKMPVATVGGLSEPAMMEEIIASGQADVVQLARALLADPDLPLKARTNREDEQIGCIRCFHCFTEVHGTHFSCALNPELGHEYELFHMRPPANRRRVLIIGGGIAGMQCALTAAGRGHQVILCERGAQLGGIMRCEDEFKYRVRNFIDRQIRMVGRSAVEVRLNTEVTPQMARETGADVIVLAAGAAVTAPPIKGIDGPNVVDIVTAYSDTARLGAHVAILGGGLSGTELSVWLSRNGRSSVVIEIQPELNSGSVNPHTRALRTIIADDDKITVRVSTRVTEVTGAGVRVEGPQGAYFIEADTVVNALGMRPLNDMADQLSPCAPEFYMIGDCISPKSIYQATNTGFHAALDIGRL